MKKWMCICATAVLAISALTRCSTSVGAATTATQTEAATTDAAKTETEEKEIAKTAEASEKARDTASEEIAVVAGKHHVKINVKNYGTISAEPCGDEAPITVANSLKLAKDGSYDGLTLHRIISGLMIQGGDPLGTGMGGSDREIEGEFSNNGMENPLSHIRGTISMTRSQIKDNASSQFFIVYEDSTFLDGDYACFGYVTKGMEVVDATCKDTKVEDNNGSVAKDNQPVIEDTEVVD